MNKTSIEWTHRPETRGAAGGMTWNPIRARIKDSALAEMQARGEKLPARNTGTFCTRISPGCQHCYASTINKRFGNGLEFTVPNLEKVEFFVDERILAEPLKTKKPCTIFVGDMFDLFHEAIDFGLIDEVMARICNCEMAGRGHTFQLLTKRPKRALEYAALCAGARPFNLAWAESILAQCRAAGVPFFMKQLGSNATYNEGPYPFRDKTRADDRKGGDPSEWPESLRVREFPAVGDREAVIA